MPKGIPANGFRMTKNRMALVASGAGPAAFAPVAASFKFPQANAAMPVAESRFTINERFGFISDMMSLLASGEQPSVVISGDAGLGKSFNVIKSLTDLGFTDISCLADFEVGTYMNMAKTFRVVKGYSSAKGLYRTLYENKDGIVVFDDTDSVLKDAVALNILKAALDSYTRRVITWNVDMKDDELPTAFEFKGKIVFISNLPSFLIDKAILSRTLSVDLTMTSAQKIERMHYLLTQPDFMPEYEQQHKQDAMNLIDELQDTVKELSLRTLVKVTKIRKANPNGNWKELAEYAICG